MDRNVYARRRVRTVDETEISSTEPEQPSPAEKLVKYFPTEAFALYAGLEPLADTLFDGDPLRWSLWLGLLLSLVLCVMFLRRFWNVRRPSQIAISCVALVVYVAALGGPFATISWWQPGFALLAAVIMTAFIIFVPAPTEPDGV